MSEIDTYQGDLEALTARYTILKAKRTELEGEKQKNLNMLIPEKLRQQINATESMYDVAFGTIDEDLLSITEKIKDMVMESAEGFELNNIQAVYRKASSLWDPKKLESLSESLPEILAARKLGKPSVTVKWKGE